MRADEQHNHRKNFQTFKKLKVLSGKKFLGMMEWYTEGQNGASTNLGPTLNDFLKNLLKIAFLLRKKKQSKTGQTVHSTATFIEA